ncbi:MAG: hypothetical protein HQK49_10060 [Oligoflexia bacterium]|nr:hypothetical protein [Oligoflexia bacterium]
MERIYKRSHINNKEIFYIVFKDLTTSKADMIIAREIFIEVGKMLESYPEHSLLVIFDVQGTSVNLEVATLIKDLSMNIYKKIKGVSIVGMYGAMQVVLTGIKLLTKVDIKATKDIEEAEIYLLNL